jgi:hypothetical protein
VEELSRRSAQEVLDDHLGISNRWGPDEDITRIVEEDLRRNVAEDCLILTNRGTFRGHQGVMELAQMLGQELPEHGAFQYTYRVAEGKMAFLDGRMKTPTSGSPTAPTPT